MISRCLDQRQEGVNHNNVEMYSPALLCFCMLLACFSFISNHGAVLGSKGEHHDNQLIFTNRDDLSSRE